MYSFAYLHSAHFYTLDSSHEIPIHWLSQIQPMAVCRQSYGERWLNMRGSPLGTWSSCFGVFDHLFMILLGNSKSTNNA